MKKILSLALALVMVLALVPATMAEDLTTTLYKSSTISLGGDIVPAEFGGVFVNATSEETGTMDARTEGTNPPEVKYYWTWTDTDLYFAIDATVYDFACDPTATASSSVTSMTGTKIDATFTNQAGATTSFYIRFLPDGTPRNGFVSTNKSLGAGSMDNGANNRLEYRITDNEDGSTHVELKCRIGWSNHVVFAAPSTLTISAKVYSSETDNVNSLAPDNGTYVATLSNLSQKITPALGTDVTFDTATGTVTFLNEDTYVCKVNGVVVDAAELTDLASRSVVEIVRAGDETTADSYPLTITVQRDATDDEEEEEEVDLGPSATPKPNPVTPGLNPGLTPGNPTVTPNPAPSSPVTFTDVDEDDWYYEDLVYVVDAGLMNGVGGNKFAPQSDLDRAMLVTVLWRLAGEPTVNVNTFDDVSYRDWFSSAVNWAAEEGIVKGYAGNFNPTDGITREQVAAILHRYADMMGYKSSNFSNRYYKTSDWAAEDVAWADANDLLDIATDMEDMTEIATRAEIAALLANFCRTFVD